MAKHKIFLPVRLLEVLLMKMQIINYSMLQYRDMLMRFWGSGVGHKNVHEATDVFHNDRHPTDDGETPAELCEDYSKEIDPVPEVLHNKKEDHGYVNPMEQDTFFKNGAPGEMFNNLWENEPELDILGPEDGNECLKNLDDLLGYTDD
ncbi:hypothetical protein H2248_000149 [Termitomyces sp. 'cryptogamus']|nr:hypothetical protein H2248_000147 [Termitomyces sp. 'cryptogamus']KAH0589966.1 hypothetical protein H2248_000149 [Termitomyces sp. 'cryptogamus']